VVSRERPLPIQRCTKIYARGQIRVRERKPAIRHSIRRSFRDCAFAPLRIVYAVSYVGPLPCRVQVSEKVCLNQGCLVDLVFHDVQTSGPVPVEYLHNAGECFPWIGIAHVVEGTEGKMRTPTCAGFHTLSTVLITSPRNRTRLAAPKGNLAAPKTWEKLTDRTAHNIAHEKETVRAYDFNGLSGPHCHGHIGLASPIVLKSSLMKRSPINARKTTSRGALTRQRIIDTTASFIYSKGVEGTSLDDVRMAASVSKSQLYHYFADKESLVREVISAQTERVLASQEAVLTQLDSLAGLRRWTERVLALNRRGNFGGCPLGSLANELANHSEQTRALLVAGFKRWEDCLAEGFARMRRSGELKSSAAPRELAIGVLCALQGGLLLAKTSRSIKPLKVALDMVLDHLAGLCQSFSSSFPSVVSGSVRKRRS